MKAKLLTTLAAALLLTVLPAQADPFRLIVTDLETPLVPNSVMDLALQQGYFEREGVEVELVRVQQTPSALAALQAGEGEMANIGVDALLLLVAGGEALKTRVGEILELMEGRPFIFNLGHGIVQHTPPEHVADLVRWVRGGAQ